MTTTDGRIYFDWAAGSAVRPSVAAALRDALPEICLNPEAVHPAGRDAAALLQDCAARLSAAVTGSEAPVIWAASGSELFRLAAAAATISAPRTTAAATVFEHPAALAAWQTHPGGCTFCKPDELAQNCGNNTGFILVSHVQSVLGTIFPVTEIIAGIRKNSPQAVIFVDTIQSAAKYDLPPGGDFYSVSAAKLGSPAGGAAWIAVSERSRKLLPLFRDIRSKYYLSGKAEPFQAQLMTLAAEEQYRNREDERRSVSMLNTFVRKELDGWRAPNGKIIKATVKAENASPWILHLYCPGYQSAVLLRMLAGDGFCVSAGSACQAETDKPERAMTESGFKKNDAYSGLRISFGFSSNLQETVKLVKKFKEILQFY